MSSRSIKDGYDIDHLPARKVLEAFLLKLDGEMDPREVRDYLRRAPSIAIPARVHQKYSETYGGRSTKAKQVQDASDLRAAVDSNFNAIKRGLLEEGFTETDVEVAREHLHRLNKEQGWY